MGFIVFIILIFMILHTSEEESRNKKTHKTEAEKCKNTLCVYNAGISEYEFEQIVLKSAKKIKRKITIHKVDNAIIYGTFLSQSGLSTLAFELNFNNQGKLTGDYWINSQNEASHIPRKLAELISQEVRRKLV